MADVVFTAEAKFERVMADYDKLRAKVAQLEQANSKMASESRKSTDAWTANFSRMQQGIMGAVSANFTLSKAISIVNEGFAEQRRLSEAANQVQLTAADAQAEVIKNLGNVSTSHATKFLADVQKIASEGGASSVAPVLQAAATTLSGIAGNEGLTKAILAEAVPLFRSKLDELPDFAGAVGDLASITGAQTQEEVRKISGMTLTTLSQARITNLAAFKEAAPAMAAVAAVDTGGDRMKALQEGGALFAAIGGAIKDPEGAITKTAAAQVAVKLRDLLPEKDTLDEEGVKRPGTGLRSLGERLAKVQADPELQRQFLQGVKGEYQRAGFRAPVMPVIEQLISGKGEAAERFKTALPVIKPDAGIVNQVRQNLELASMPLVSATGQRKADAVVEDIQLDSVTGRSASARNIMQKTLAVTRPGFFTFMPEQAAQWRYRGEAAKYGSEEAAIMELEARKRAISQKSERVVAGFGITGRVEKWRETSETEKLWLQKIDEQIAILRKMQADFAKVATVTTREAASKPITGDTTVAAGQVHAGREAPQPWRDGV